MNKKIGKVLMLILSILMIMTIVGCSKKVDTDLAPAEHVIEALKKTGEEKNFDVSVDLTLDLDANKIKAEFPEEDIDAAMIELLNNVSMAADFKVITDDPDQFINMFMNFDLNYDSNPILALEFLMNSDVIGFGLTNFYDKYFTLGFDQLMDEVTKQLSTEDMGMLAELDFNKYLNILKDTESDAYKKVHENEVYEDILEAHLETQLDKGTDGEITYTVDGKEKTEDVITYATTLDYDAYIKLIEDIFKELENDENAKAYLQYIANEVLDELIESKDYEIFDLKEEDILGVKLALTTEFDSFWDEFFVGFNMGLDGSEIGNIDEEIYEDVMDIAQNIDMAISVNEDGMVRAVQMSMDDEGVVFKANFVINATGKDVVIEDKKDKYIDFLQFVNFENPSELNNQEELAVMIKEILEGGITELLEGEGFKALFEDLEPFEAELGMAIDELQATLQLGKGMIANMSTEDIMMYIDSVMPTDYDFDEFGDEFDDGDSDDDSYDDEVIFEDYELNHVTFIDTELADTFEEVNGILQGLLDNETQMDYTSDYFIASPNNAMDQFEAAIANGSNVVIVRGGEFMELVSIYAQSNPEVQFIYIDTYLDEVYFNIINVDFYNEESAYVAGYAAGLSTETGSVGFIGGFEDLYTQNYEVAFTNGALAANPEVYVFARYADSLTDAELGKTIALELLQDNVDIIYHAAGEVGIGMIDASVENNYKFIGNESEYGIELDTYLTATMRDYYYVIADLLMNYQMYGVEGTYYSYGVYDFFLYLTTGNMAEDVLTQVVDVIDQISTGELFVPIYYGE